MQVRRGSCLFAIIISACVLSIIGAGRIYAVGVIARWQYEGGFYVFIISHRIRVELAHHFKLIQCVECFKCVRTSKGKITCCGRGGSWYGKCGSPGDTEFDHTWDEGQQACLPSTPADLSQFTTPVTEITNSKCSLCTMNAFSLTLVCCH